MCREHLLRREPRERWPTGEQLVAERADRINVDAVVEVRIRRRLLGRHVGRRPERDARGGELLASAGLAHGLRHTEVHHQRVAPRQQDVVGLDVAMHHAVLMRMRERVHHLAQNPHGVVHRELAVLGEPLPQGLAFHVRHDVIEEALCLARVQEREDVGMLQLGGDFDLAEEAVFTQRRGELRPEYLHRDPAVVLHVLGEVDSGHPPTAELALDRVMARKGRPHAF